jgi:hypothetical protein
MMARTHATRALLMPVAPTGCRPVACCAPQHPAA